MSLLKKMAQAAIRKAFLSQVTGNAPAAIKSSIEQLCSDAPTVDVLQHYATVRSKQEGQFPLTPAIVAELGLPEASQSLLLADSAVLLYLNNLLTKFQQN